MNASTSKDKSKFKSSGSFKPGNKVAVGNSGPPPRLKIITSVIIQKLNEIDPKDKNTRANVWKLVDELFSHALGREVTTGSGKNKKTVKLPGELAAIKEIIDRCEGKSVQAVGIDAEGVGKVSLVFEAFEEKI